MTDQDPFDYPQWLEESLRGVIKRALREAARRGLTGDHHFYIAVKTDEQGVMIPEYLKAQYPDEIVLVLENQFDDLEVSDEGFGVTLYFGGKPERLQIPFSAVSAFTDPSVNFALQMRMEEVDGASGPDNASAQTATGEPQKQRGGLSGQQQKPEDEQKDADVPKENADVIPLDTYRKKEG